MVEHPIGESSLQFRQCPADRPGAPGYGRSVSVPRGGSAGRCCPLAAGPHEPDLRHVRSESRRHPAPAHRPLPQLPSRHGRLPLEVPADTPRAQDLKLGQQRPWRLECLAVRSCRSCQIPPVTESPARRRPWHLDRPERRDFTISIVSGLIGNILSAIWVFVSIKAYRDATDGPENFEVPIQSFFLPFGLLLGLVLASAFTNKYAPYDVHLVRRSDFTLNPARWAKMTSDENDQNMADYHRWMNQWVVRAGKLSIYGCVIGLLYFSAILFGWIAAQNL